MCTVFPTNKITHAIHPNETNCPHTIYPNGINRSCAICPNETVGAAPVCPPERPHSGVSIPKIHALCAGYLTTDAPLWGDTGGHIGTAPTHLHHIFPHIPHKQNNHLHAIRPKETNRPCAIRPYPSPSNRTVCHYPIGVILSIAQGWQVQRSLPWVTMQARRLPPWGLYFFSSHIITTRGK